MASYCTNLAPKASYSFYCMSYLCAIAELILKVLLQFLETTYHLCPIQPILYKWCKRLFSPLIQQNKYILLLIQEHSKKISKAFCMIVFSNLWKQNYKNPGWDNLSYSTLSNIFNSIIRTRQLIMSVSTRVLVGVVVVVLEKKTSLICQSPPHHVHQFIIIFARCPSHLFASKCSRRIKYGVLKATQKLSKSVLDTVALDDKVAVVLL